MEPGLFDMERMGHSAQGMATGAAGALLWHGLHLARMDRWALRGRTQSGVCGVDVGGWVRVGVGGCAFMRMCTHVRVYACVQLHA